MKRLIFLIWLLMPVIALANNSNVVIGDSTFFNYTHTTAIDSAQLILIRGAVKDTLSLMPIVGSNHKMVEWENIFNHVDSAGTYQVWIESYNDDAIIDTILGTCQVELAARDVNVVQISGDGGAADNFESMVDGTGGNDLTLNKLSITAGGNDTGLVVRGGAGTGSALAIIGNASSSVPAAYIIAGSGSGKPALSLVGDGAGLDLDATLNLDDLTGDFAIGDFAGVSAFWNEGKTGYSLSDANIAILADTLLQADTASHNNVAGSYGEFLYKPQTVSLPDSVAGMVPTLDSVKAAISGSGPRLCSLMVVDATPAAITDGTVSMTSGATIYEVDISGAGFAVLSLTDATWTGLAYATGYAQDTIPQTFVISASVRDTITMTAISISSPSAADKVTCYLYTYDIMGAVVENAKLTATINGNGPWFAADDSAAIMIPKKVSAKTNSSGYVEIELWESAEVIDAEGDNPTFDFTLEKSNYLKWEVKGKTTPDAVNWNIK